MIKNTHQSYGFIAVFFHWLMAIGVFFLFGLGLYMVELGYYDSWYQGSQVLHKSIGICLFILWFLRLFWRLANDVHKASFPTSTIERIEQTAAHWMHRLLYLVMLLLLCSGYLISTADGRAIVVFEMFEVPAIEALIANQEDVAGDVHLILAWTLIGLVSIHAFAAIKHHFIDKDDALKKMIIWK